MQIRLRTLEHRCAVLTSSALAPQPLDAAAAIFDGGLLGASDRTYVSKAMFFTAAVSCAVLTTVRHLELGAWLAFPCGACAALCCCSALVHGESCRVVSMFEWDACAGLIGVWFGIKFLTFGRVTSGALRVMSPRSPFAEEQKVAFAT